MRKISFISCAVIVVFATSIAFFFFGRGNYELYLCKTREQSYSCKGCEELEKITLKVIKEQNAVLMQLEDGKTQTFSSCKIFDDKNWDCSKEPWSSGTNFIFSERSMKNGVLTWNSIRESSTDGSDGSYACAK
jgi:hypothetical protein